MSDRRRATEQRRRRHPVLQLLVVCVAIVVPPLLGATIVGRPLASLLAFPPRPPRIDQPPFSWPVFGCYLIGIVATLTPLVHRLATTRRGRAAGPAPARATFPLWGWAGLALIAAAWMVAWSSAAPDSVRRHAFTPLWAGFIVFLQAWLKHRTGICRITRTPVRFLALFPASAVFWWSFEYLNRFVGNWVYRGAADLGPWEYALAATLPFATVLPAVVSMRDCLATCPALYQGLRSAWRAPLPPARPAATALLLGAMAVLGLVPVFPAWLFAALWLAPLAIITAVQILSGDRHVLAPLARGDWSSLWLGSLAGLVCGFLWEFWNWASLARWTYHIPYVERFHLFEMPILGYAGYLPFGLACLAAAHLLTGRGLADTRIETGR